ncbi:ABC transporter ATP-binding protein, partial [Bacteroidota bacterium]
LEEALEYLDETERKQIVDFLINADNDWTIVAVSSDNYFQSKADKVIEMKGGRFTHLSTK